MIDRRAAARYAEALLGLAQANEQVEEVRRELQQLVELQKASSNFQSLLARPDLEAPVKLEILRNTLGRVFSNLVIALFATLLKHQRGDHLPAVLEKYEALADELAGVVRAEAYSAVPLTEVERNRLMAALNRFSGKRVEFTEQINPSLLAGVLIRIGDQLIDGSAAGRLQRMREELMSVSAGS